MTATFYMAEAVTDYDIILDTVETPVRWDNIHEIHGKVYEYANSVPGTMCISHASHFYQSGTNLYFIFGVRGNVDDYMAYRSGLIEAMVNAGGSCSHHHGVGRLMTPWIGRFLGKEELGAIRALKKYFDPGNILNPGHPRDGFAGRLKIPCAAMHGRVVIARQGVRFRNDSPDGLRAFTGVLYG